MNTIKNLIRENWSKTSARYDALSIIDYVSQNEDLKNKQFSSIKNNHEKSNIINGIKIDTIEKNYLYFLLSLHYL